MDKSEKRSTFNYKNFGENIKSNIKLRKLYKDRKLVEVDGKGKHVRNALFGVKCIDGDDEEDEEVSELDAM